MHIGVLGLNHRSTPVDLRERVAFQAGQVPAALESVRRELGIQECVILSTCNRVELYALLPEVDGHADRLQRFLAQFHRLPAGHLNNHTYWYLQPDSVRHLFRVAAGLDSMVLGGAGILGQVREAYGQAVSCGGAGSVFHRLF
ncbi:MAG: glutamyl-tRNA reductase, partial [Candidatus Omnitrophica bacterium]|nr:glutamyl-tRNA reductase [Candidatus Omnitrophota bacterium]